MAEDPSSLPPPLAADRERYGAPLTGEAHAALFAEIAAETIDRRPSPLERLRLQPTWTRILLGLGLGLIPGGLVLLLLGFRTDLRETGLLMPTMLLVLAVMGGLSVVVSLRGMHRRPLGRAAWIFAGLALIGPVLLALVPGIWPGHPEPARFLPWETGCFWFGAAVALPCAGAIVLLQRTTQPAAWRILTAAGAGGCVGFIVQQLFCPANDVWHIVTAHSFVGLFVGVLLLLPLWLRPMVTSP